MGKIEGLTGMQQGKNELTATDARACKVEGIKM